MKEKILAVLKTKFAGVPDAILDRIATQRAKTVTTEDQVNSLVEGMSLQNIFDSYGDSRATEATQTAIVNYEKKHNIKDGKSIESPNSNPQQQPTADSGSDIAKLISEAVSQAVKPISDKLLVFEQKEALSQRSVLIASKAKEYGIPENFISRFNIAEDADLDEYMKSVKQDFANIGFEGVKPPESGAGPAKNGEYIANLINTGTKQIVEQNKK